MKFSQGHLPSCQTLAAIGSLALHVHGKPLLEKMVKKDAEGYTVTFPKHPESPIKISCEEIKAGQGASGTVALAERTIGALQKEFVRESYFWLAYPDRPRHVTGDELVRVLELAYAKYQLKFFAQKYSPISEKEALTVYRSKSFHYQSDDSLRDLTGWDVETLAAGESPSDSSKSYAERAAEKPQLQQMVIDKLTELSRHDEDFIVTTCTKGSPGSKMYHDPGGKIVPWHDHIVSNVNCDKQTINVIDPYNSRIAMVLHYADYFEYFYLLSIAKVPNVN